MKWLRRLLNPRVEEAAAAPSAPPTEPSDRYAAHRDATVWTCTCAGCGRVETVDGGRYSYPTPKGWGRGYNNGTVLACPDCVDVLRAATDELTRERDRVWRANSEARKPAIQAMHEWDAANPSPKWVPYPSKEVFSRRTTCGRCGTVVDVEAPLHAMPPRPEGWQREGGGQNGHGAIVCPACFEAAAPLRQEFAEWKARRNAAVGDPFRAAPKYPDPVIRLPASWRS